VKELNSGVPKPLLFIAIFLTQIDDGGDSLRLGKVPGAFHREGRAHRELLGQPVKIDAWISPEFTHAASSSSSTSSIESNT
jgi:hypothetical protein